MSDIPPGDGDPNYPKRKFRSPQSKSTGHAKRDSSRARILANAPNVAERVNEVVRLMAHGEWYGAATRLELATRWGVELNTISVHAAEASRRLAIPPEQIDTERAAHAAFASRMQRDATSRVNLITGLPDYASALKANEQAARFKGIELDARASVSATGPISIEVKVCPDEPEPPAVKHPT